MMEGEVLRKAMGRDPVAGVGTPERVSVVRVDISLADLMGLWFKVAAAAVPLVVVIAIGYAIVRWL